LQAIRKDQHHSRFDGKLGSGPYMTIDMVTS
jgi:hypothetical protein